MARPASASLLLADAAAEERLMGPAPQATSILRKQFFPARVNGHGMGKQL